MFKGRKKAIALALSCALSTSCNLVTYNLPCFLRGKWISYENSSQASEIAEVMFDFDSDGNYCKTEPDSNFSTKVETYGKYEYSYSSYNYQLCTGTITLYPDDRDESEEYSFEVEMNAQNGPVSLALRSVKERIRYDMEYAGVEEIYASGKEAEDQ